MRNLRLRADVVPSSHPSIYACQGAQEEDVSTGKSDDKFRRMDMQVYSISTQISLFSSVYFLGLATVPCIMSLLMVNLLGTSIWSISSCHGRSLKMEQILCIKATIGSQKRITMLRVHDSAMRISLSESSHVSFASTSIPRFGHILQLEQFGPSEKYTRLTVRRC